MTQSETKDKATNETNAAPASPPASAPAPAPSPEAPKVKEKERPKVKKAGYDQEMAAYITGSQRVILTLQDDPILRGALSKKSFDAQRIQTGLALTLTAQTAFNARQEAVGDQKKSSDNIEIMETDARQHYVDFREIARGEYTTDADRTTLGLKGNVPRDQNKFITVARASYTAAKKEPYVAELGPYEYTAADLDMLLEELSTLTKARKTHKTILKSVPTATRRRDKSVGTLKKWMGRLRRVSKVVFRKDRELAKKLDF